jgi:hypothetical protein
MSKLSGSKNALKHGVYASDVVLSWENVNDFKDLHESFREEYRPVGASEEEAVFDLARLHWMKRRLNIGSQLAFHRHPDAAALTDAGSGGWPGVAEYIKGTSGDGDRVAEAFRALARSHVATVQKVHSLIGEQADLISPCASSADPAERERKQTQSAEFDRLVSMMKELNVMNKELIVPALHLIENYDVDQKVAARAYRPDIMERNLKTEAEIDKRIEKAITRLVTIKEYKKLYSSKEIEGSTEVLNLPAKRIRQSDKA